jgi:hypothetical protein
VDLVEQDAVGHRARSGSRQTWSVKRTLYPTSPPSGTCSSSATRSAIVRGEPPRLGVRDALAAELEQDLRQLRGLAGSGRAGDHDHLMVADRAAISSRAALTGSSGG